MEGACGRVLTIDCPLSPAAERTPVPSQGVAVQVPATRPEGGGVRQTPPPTSSLSRLQEGREGNWQPLVVLPLTIVWDGVLAQVWVCRSGRALHAMHLPQEASHAEGLRHSWSWCHAPPHPLLPQELVHHLILQCSPVAMALEGQNQSSGYA